jgi:hypothetical protein
VKSVVAYLYTNKHGLGYEEAYAKISKWAAKYPNSPTPHILRSMVMMNQAWSTLGEDEIEQQKPARLTAFYRQIEAARQTRETAKATAATDPKWYEEMIKLSPA